MSKAAAILAVLCTTAGLASYTAAGQADSARIAPSVRAHVAHTLKASDTAHLRYLSASGSLLLEEGQTNGTLPGKMRARVNVGSTFTGSFVTYTRYGTIVGHGNATPHGSGTYESFSGTLVVTGGSGRYAHAHGRAGLYGTFNRDNYAFVVQTTGTLLY
ncbi:MAG TPA: hypothetical protein VGL79_03595 [Solirubrobacteraceae bacterium]|jgi:hypothetical protein